MSGIIDKVFEDEFMEVQSGLISLCLEFVKNAVDKIYAYCSIEADSSSFNAFFEVNGQIKSTNDIEAEQRMIFKFLNTGLLDLEDIREICQKHNKPTPTEMKLYYDVNSGKFNADYKYTPVCVDKCAGDIFDEWKAEYENK